MPKELSNIIYLIEQGDLNDAINSYARLSRANQENISLISFRYNFLRESFLNGMITFEEYSVKLNILTKAILASLHELKKIFN